MSSNNLVLKKLLSGNYVGSTLVLEGNLLTRFKAGAFKLVLEQMANSSSGSVTVGGSKK